MARPHHRYRRPSRRPPLPRPRRLYGATANGGALCCDATLVSPLTRTGHPHPCTVQVDGAALPGVARRSFWSCAPRSEAAGTLLRRVSFATWSGSEPSARCQQRAPRRLPAGPGVGGEFSLSRSSSPLRARRWAVLGRRPRYLHRAPALTGPGARPRRRRRAQPLAPAALTRDREPS